MRLAGLTPLTTIDFPGHLAAVLFCQGCAWTCPYCHNRSLQPCRPGSLDWASVESFLAERRNVLDGVVISGGEPTLQHDLPEVCARLHDLGFAVGLHTSGQVPVILGRALPHLDWVALDIKAPFDPRMDAITGQPGAAARVDAALTRLWRSGRPYETRTTLDPHVLTPGDLIDLADDLAARGVGPWVLQRWRPATHDPRPMANDAPLWAEDLHRTLARRMPGLAARGVPAAA